MLRPTTYGAVSELKAAGDLYPIRIEVYRNGDLLGVFGVEGRPIKRFLFTGDLSSGHYDVCKPVMIISTSPEVQDEITDHSENANTSRRGRPRKQKQGRPKTSEKSRAKQLRESSQRYRKTHPEVNRIAVKRYTDKNPEVHQSAVKRYTEKNPEVHQRAVKRYTDRNAEVNRTAVKRYTDKNPQVNRLAVKKYAKKNPEVIKKTANIYQAKKKFAFTGENDIVNKLTDKIKDRLEAEKIVKWVLQRRKNMLDNYFRVFERIQTKIVISIEKFKNLPPDAKTTDKFTVLAGESKHQSDHTIMRVHINY
ncbi:hypothetical protein B5X24_HaOG212152 [Helicoverpa armigera]|nr:hypothetical protein B5X24_HaOG212152 [Helicoverpa armigera]